MTFRTHDDLLWHGDGPVGHAIRLFSVDDSKGYAHKTILRKRIFLSKLPEFLKMFDRKLAKYQYLGGEAQVLDPASGGKTLEEQYGGAQPWEEEQSKGYGYSLKHAADNVMTALHLTSGDGVLEYVDVLSGPAIQDSKLASQLMLRNLTRNAQATTFEAAKAIFKLVDLNDMESPEYREYKVAEARMLHALKELAGGLEKIFQWAKAVLEPGSGYKRPE